MDGLIAVRGLISRLWGIHLTGVRDVAAATDHPPARARFSRVLEVADALKQVRYQDLIAAGEPRHHPRRCPCASRERRMSVHGRPAASNGTGNSGYMDTPESPYVNLQSHHWRPVLFRSGRRRA